MTEAHLFNIYDGFHLPTSSLIVGWAQDTGRLGAQVIDCLNRGLGGKEFGEIEPEGFFPLSGVSIQDDVAQFPESKFYCCRENNLVLFKSDLPRFDWYKFLSLIVDIAERYCNVREIYTVGGIFASSAHTTPREMFAIPNSPETKQVLQGYGLIRETEMEYETPLGQRPTLNSFLLWVAKRRGIAAAGIWTTVPFYLAALDDPRACRKTLEFFDRKFNLGMDFADIDKETKKQNDKMARLRFSLPEIDSYIQNVESNLGLTEQEVERLSAKVEEYLNKRD